MTATDVTSIILISDIVSEGIYSFAKLADYGGWQYGLLLLSNAILRQMMRGGPSIKIRRADSRESSPAPAFP
jgi:hypothetical protein